MPYANLADLVKPDDHPANLQLPFAGQNTIMIVFVGLSGGT
jgi:hypothetical protein